MTKETRDREDTRRGQRLVFAVVGDLHIGAGSEAVQTMIRVVNRDPLDFVLFLGDLTNKAEDAEVRLFTETIRQIQAPVYLTIGNHDTARILQGYDIEAAIRKGRSGPWDESFTYAFDAKEWRFIVTVAYCDEVSFKGRQVHNRKGHVSESGGVVRIPDDHMARLKALLEASDGHPTCLVTHVPLVHMAQRIYRRKCYDQVRYLEDIHLWALLDEHPNVKMVLNGHQHFNQVEVADGRLHCVTQGVQGYPPYRDPDAIRIVEIDGARVRSWLTWDDRPAEPPGSIGTLEGDRAFEWKIPQD